MTDAEVIKALECCANEDAYCEDCPSKQCCDGDTFGMIQAVLDLISRQKAEIDILIRKKETLQDEIAEQQAEIESINIIWPAAIVK